MKIIFIFLFVLILLILISFIYNNDIKKRITGNFEKSMNLISVPKTSNALMQDEIERTYDLSWKSNIFDFHKIETM